MNYRTERLPVVTFTIIGINTLVYLVSLIYFFGTGGGSELWIRQYLWLIPAKSFFWTYLTSMFVHAGILHLLGNMIFLFLFGSCVEDIIGRARFLAFYLLGGLAAELVYIAASPDHFSSSIPMGGASGAISAAMGMYLLLRTQADIEFKYFYWLFFITLGSGEFELPAWVAISFWFCKDLFWMVLGYLAHEPIGGVAFGAHVGGLLAGLALIGINKMFTGRQATPPADPGYPPAAMTALTPAATGETPTIYVFETDKQSGPYTLTQIQQMLARGSLSREALYWSEGMAGWESILDLAGQPIA
ncbi:MAG TPA: rhomboid family intramembrane serine protease [Verrucomicrobiae bacterium]|nr:rhomboid family intramembrane serine protease [Verrucomicrobiae bacterium]